MLLDVEVPSFERAGTTALVMAATMELSGARCLPSGPR